MKIGIQTTGTNGDIRPYLAMANGLVASGHDVTLVVASVDGKVYDPGNSGGLTIEYIGKEYYQSSWKDDYRQIWLKDAVDQAQLSLAKQFYPVLDELAQTAKQLCDENDLVIGNQLQYPLVCAAQKSQTPYVSFSYVHLGYPSRYVPPSGLPNLGKYFNFFWWNMVTGGVNKLYKENVNRLRLAHSMPPVKNVLKEIWLSKQLNLIGVSSVFCSAPKDWDKLSYVCGRVDLPEKDENQNIPLELIEFINSGYPPVFFTLGSMTMLEHGIREIMAIFTEAIRLSGCRAILQVSKEDFDCIPNDSSIYKIDQVAHQFIFPFCSAVVHHGGAGATHAATRAGCPSIVVAYAFDQSFWGSELNRIGIAEKPLYRKTVNAKELAQTIKTTLASGEKKKRAEAFGEVMKREQGVKRTVELIERVLQKSERKRSYATT